jgi:membrane protein
VPNWKTAWEVEGVGLRQVTVRVWKSMWADRVFGHAAELGFYFLFALFPTLFCAASFLGLAARSAHQISDRLLTYLSLVIPSSALGTVISTFNQTTAAATPGKLTFGTIAAVWTASVGVSAIQDALNVVCKLDDRRSWLGARLHAILVTFLLTGIIASALACLFAGSFFSALAVRHLRAPVLGWIARTAIRIVGWSASICLLALSFAVIRYWVPDWRKRRWRWHSPGIVIGIAGWLIASLVLRIYLHYFNTYTLTYGSLGAVIILLMWFYISGLMLLLGAEIDTEIDESREEARLAAAAAERSALEGSS